MSDFSDEDLTKALSDLAYRSSDDGWEAVRDRLRAEGLIDDDRAFHRRRVARAVAAAGALAATLAFGVVLGRATAPVADATDAIARYAQTTRSQSTDTMSQMAALQAIVRTTSEALREAPADPLINGYHLAAITQREALLHRDTNTPRGGRWF